MMEKGNSVLIIQLGSHTIKLGFANDRHPVTVRSLVARKIS